MGERREKKMRELRVGWAVWVESYKGFPKGDFGLFYIMLAKISPQ